MNKFRAKFGAVRRQLLSVCRKKRTGAEKALRFSAEAYVFFRSFADTVEIFPLLRRDPAKTARCALRTKRRILAGWRWIFSGVCWKFSEKFPKNFVPVRAEADFLSPV